MGSGLARGAAARGKRIAFGDGKRIIWGPLAADIYRGNPNVAPPGVRSGLEWIEHYPSARLYNRMGKGRWIWNYEFKAVPGELFFDQHERAFADSIAPGFVLIEPNVPRHKSVAPNKQWPVDRYQAVADALTGDGQRVLQFDHGGPHRLANVERIKTLTFRLGLAVLSRAALFIGPEGGLHHGAAAVNVKAVVIFGGFIPPAVTGYDMHVNLAAAGEACGSLQRCGHCAAALDAISVEQVIEAARSQLA